MPTDDRPLRARDPRERSACPRCGARMGVLDASAGDDASRYCGCCGLVMPPTTPDARRPAPDAR